MGTPADLDAGRAAVAAHRWREGYDLLSAADRETNLTAADLELLAWSAYWTEQIGEVATLMERAYAAHLAEGNTERAAATAVQLAHEYTSVRLQNALGAGWLARARRLLADLPEGRVHGYLALQQGLEALVDHDFDRAHELAEIAERVGREHGDRALELRGQQRRAVALIHRGDVEEGRLLLNEVNTAAYSGEIEPYSTVALYCNAIGTCRDVAAYDEAAQWTERAEAYCNEYSVAAFPGVCRINRAEVMRYEGKLQEAETAAAQASEQLAGWAPRIAGAAYAEVGEVRLRLGDLAKAEEAFDRADDFAHDPEPGRSLLQLARGRTAAALASIRRALADDLPAVARARLLPALVEIALAAGEVELAAPAAAELAEIAERYDTPALHASAQLAGGAVALARGETAEAVRQLRRALRLWQETRARYEAARTRVLLADAYAADGDEEGAMHERAKAGSVFDQLGARLDAQRIDALLGREHGTRVARTFAFTDIVDSTRHLEHLGDVHWQKLLRRHDELVRAAVAGHGGEVVDHTGDGFFLSFAAAADAVAAAAEIQRAAERELPFDLRIGLHADEATRVGANYRGKGVHVAARVGARAAGGEILASAATVADLDVRTGPPRAEQLKGLSEPVELVALEWRGR